MGLPNLNYDDLAPTRDYLQDVAKVVGKLQQLFLPPAANESQRGLEVCDDGLMSQPFMLHGETYQVFICFSLGCVELDHISWELAHHSAPDLLDELQKWLAAKGSDKVVEKPQLSTSEPHFDLNQAKKLGQILSWSEDQFESIKGGLNGGQSSPILLFPHHFDLSLSWYLSDEHQLSLGFSFGDNDIAEPYYYLTFWPKNGNFEKQSVKAPFYWNSKGFNGLVLPYKTLQNSDAPEKLLTEFWQTAINSQSR